MANFDITVPNHIVFLLDLWLKLPHPFLCFYLYYYLCSSPFINNALIRPPIYFNITVFPHQCHCFYTYLSFILSGLTTCLFHCILCMYFFFFSIKFLNKKKKIFLLHLTQKENCEERSVSQLPSHRVFVTCIFEKRTFYTPKYALKKCPFQLWTTKHIFCIA